MTERRFDPAEDAWRTVSTGPAPPDPECSLCPSRPEAPTRIPRAAFEVAVLEQLAGPPAREEHASDGALYRTAPHAGTAELVVYADRHDATLATVGRHRVETLIHVWAERYAELGSRRDVAYVLVSEDRAPGAGRERGHPHGRIDAYPEIPPRPLRRLERARKRLATHETCVLCDVVAWEQADGVRLVAKNESFVAFVPFAPRVGYELHVLARRHAPSLLDLTDPERAALAELLELVVEAYDGSSGAPLPYALAVHQAPTDDGLWQPVSHFQIEFTPVGALSASALAAEAFAVEARPETMAADLRAALA